MGGTISKDVEHERWVREPGMIPHRSYSDPGGAENSGLPVIPVFKRRRSQPFSPWIDQSVEKVTYEPRSASAPPAVDTKKVRRRRSFSQRRRSTDDTRSITSKKSEKSLKDKAKAKKGKRKKLKKEKKKNKEKKARKSKKGASASSTDGGTLGPATSNDEGSGSETESEAEPEPPPPPPEPQYSFANPRVAKVGGSVFPRIPNPWAALNTPTAPLEPHYSFNRPRMAVGRQANPYSSGKDTPDYSFSNPRVATRPGAPPGARPNFSTRSGLAPVRPESTSDSSSSSEEVVIVEERKPPGRPARRGGRAR